MDFFRGMGVLVLFSCIGLVTGNGYWSSFVSGQFYKDFKLAVLGNPFPSLGISAVSEIAARLECGIVCGRNAACQGFNVYFNVTSFVCERLSTNLRLNKSQIAFVPQPGSFVWEKLAGGATLPFIDQTLKGITPGNYCETIRRGCIGPWPGCSNCVQSCIDCQNRYNYNGSFTCTMWPGPAGPGNTPIVTTCYDKYTHLIRRSVDLANGQVTDHHILPFRDMNRLCRLNAYKLMQFAFFTTNAPWWYQALYSNPYIDENGTLTGLTFFSANDGPGGDGLALGTNTLTPVPFVVVHDDRYHCGSLWLFKTANATYCPGGDVSFFGTPKFNTMTGQVVDTGIHWPLATTNKDVLYRMDLALIN